MKLIEQSHETLHIDDLNRVEIAGRTCYKSEDKITEDSADSFVRMLIKRRHEAMLEHGSATVRFVTNRGVSHELVRHRVASFGQESTRYVKYDGEMEFIRPVWFTEAQLDAYYEDIVVKPKPKDYIIGDHSDQEVQAFMGCCRDGEIFYKIQLQNGLRPEQAREVLPNALKTEIVVTANFREWRHIFNLRAVGTTGKPHPQMQALMLPVLKEFYDKCPAMFEDIYNKAVEKGLYCD